MSSIDHDIALALHEERPRLIRALVRRRARREWQRLQEQGAAPETVTDSETDTTHWLVADGLTHFAELAACGEDLGAILYAEGGRGLRDRSRPVGCRRCLRLLASLRDDTPADEPTVLAVAAEGRR